MSGFDKGDLITESYFWRKWEIEFAKKMKPIFRDLGAHNVGDGNDVYADVWHRNGHVIQLNPEGHKAGNYIRFDQFDYENKEELHGQTSVIEKGEEEVDGWGYEFDQRKLFVPYHIDITDEVEFSNSKHHRLQTEIHFDQTLEAGGNFYGVDVKSTTTAGDSTEDEEDKGSETTHKQSLEYHGTVLPGRGLILTATKKPVITETPRTVSGYLKCRVQLDFQDNIGITHSQISMLLFGGRHHTHRSEYWFDSILDVVRFLRGYDPDYPHMDKFLGLCSQESRDAVAWLEDKANRRAMQLHSVDRTEFDNFAKIIPTPMEPLADQADWDSKRKAYFEGEPELEVEAEAKADDAAEESSDKETGAGGE